MRQQECCKINFGDHELTLLPEGAVYWEAEQTLFVADTHFGKETTFHKLSIPVPSLLDNELIRLSRLLNETDSKRLIVLGDLLHSRRGRCTQLEDEVAEWRQKHLDVNCMLVRGNHDLASGDPPADWRFECVDSPAMLGGMTLAHHPDEVLDRWTICGHLHPKVRYSSRVDTLQLPCFLVRNQTLVLPAFAKFVDHGVIETRPDDRVYAIADDEVLKLELS